MKNINFSKIIIVALLIIIASLSTISLTARNYEAGSQPNALIKIINDGTGSVDQFFMSPVRFFQSKVNDFQNTLNTYDQNQSLKQQLSALTSQNQQLAALKEENAQLKTALDLKNTLANYDTTAANVITRNPSSWNDLFIIDKGSSNGLKLNMIVMANGGIIGRISQVNEATSKVELLTSSKNLVNKVPVQIGKTYGLLSDFDSRAGYYVISNLTNSDTFSKGEAVVTSGLGGDSPSQLPLGTIVGVSGASSDPNRKVYVKPSSNFYNVQIVTVVERSIEGN
jgi:rod shape-determining protein MreC